MSDVKKEKIKYPIAAWVLVGLTAANIMIYWNVLGKDDVHVYCEDKLQIQQIFGVLHFYQYIRIDNMGSKAGRITKIAGFVRSKERTDETEFKKKITAQGYYFNSQEGYFPLIELTIPPRGFFNSTVDFFKPPDRFTADSINILQSTLVNETEKYNDNPNKNFIVLHASKKTSSLITSFINKRIQDFQPGEYEYIIQMTKDDEKTPFFTKCYSFILYESSIAQIDESILDQEKLNRSFNANYIRPIVGVYLTEIQTQDIVTSLKNELMH